MYIQDNLVGLHYHSYHMPTINQRDFPCAETIEAALHLESGKNYFCELNQHTVLEVSGEKALEFLQGQLTCNVEEINAQTMRRSALCNLKGRIITLMDVVCWQNRFFLILPNDLLETTRQSLLKVALFSRVTLTPLTSCKIYGLLIDKAPFLLDENLEVPESTHAVSSNDISCCYRLNEECAIFITHQPHISLPRTLIEKMSGELTWHAARLKQGIPSIYLNSRGLFLPHHLGLQHTSVLSFEKGCYKGQEIIARMHYRAKIKHTPKLILVQNVNDFFPGQKIYHAETRLEIGEIIDFSPVNQEQSLLLITSTQPASQAIFFENAENNIVLPILF